MAPVDGVLTQTVGIVATQLLLCVPTIVMMLCVPTIVLLLLIYLTVDQQPLLSLYCFTAASHWLVITGRDCCVC